MVKGQCRAGGKSSALIFRKSQMQVFMRTSARPLRTGGGKMNTSGRCMLFLVACLLLGLPAWCGHTLTAQEQRVLKGWLAQHPKFRVATEEDCDCADDIKQ